MGWPRLLFGVLRHPIFLLLAALGLGWALIAVNNEGYQGPPERPESTVVASVTLAVLDGENGAVRVLTAESSTEVRVYGPGEGSFCSDPQGRKEIRWRCAQGERLLPSTSCREGFSNALGSFGASERFFWTTHPKSKTFHFEIGPHIVARWLSRL